MFLCNSHGTARFSTGLGNSQVSLRLIGLKMSPHILAHIHIGNINAENLESSTGIKSLIKNKFGDGIGIFQNSLVGFR